MPTRDAAVLIGLPVRALGRIERAMLAFVLVTCLAASIALGEEPAASGEPEYRLGVEDVLQIQVWGKPELGGTAVVDYSGKIQLPLIGEIEAEHRTPSELGALIQSRYRLMDSEVTQVLVTIVQFNSQSVTIVGEVRTPGKLGFRSIPDLWTVILAAGGATPRADLARVQIVRKDPRGSEPKIVTVDLSQGLTRAPGGLPVLRAKDTIVLPSLEESAVQGDRFQILGAVRVPGFYRTGAAKNVVEALGASGGPLPEANLAKVVLTRSSGEYPIAYELDLKSYMENGRPLQVSEILPGDIVTVPQGHGSLLGRLTLPFSLATSVISLILATRR